MPTYEASPLPNPLVVGATKTVVAQPVLVVESGSGEGTIPTTGQLFPVQQFSE